MSRRQNIINFVGSLLVAIIALSTVVFVCNSTYNEQLTSVLLKFLVGALIAGFLNTFFHELAHLFIGKKNGFVFSSFTVWFFKWYKDGDKIKFAFTMFGEELGYTEMIPTHVEDLCLRLKKMTIAGPMASLVIAIIGLLAFIIPNLSVWAYCILAMFLPIGAYSFVASILPESNYGVRNDGGVVYGLKHQDDVAKVTISLLSIQAEMYQGKTPAQVDEKLYFDLPQLPEDDYNFIMLLNARYFYYLDKEDYENAKKVTERLVGLVDDVIKDLRAPILVNALYNACTFDFDEDVADDIVYETEKYLNAVNTATNLRAKLAYLLYVKGETELLDIFYKKGVKEADKCQIKGFAVLENKLFDKMKKDFEK